jgi:hypothetical protein
MTSLKHEKLFVAILAGQSFSLVPLQEPVSHLWPYKQHFKPFDYQDQ